MDADGLILANVVGEPLAKLLRAWYAGRNSVAGQCGDVLECTK